MSAFAGRLWRLKQEAGDPSYEEMSVRLGAAASRSSLAAAAKGRSLPSWETTWEFVRVLAVDRLGRDARETEREWREHWRQAKVAELSTADAAPGPGLAGAATPGPAATPGVGPAAESGAAAASPASKTRASAPPAGEAGVSDASEAAGQAGEIGTGKTAAQAGEAGASAASEAAGQAGEIGTGKTAAQAGEAGVSAAGDAAAAPLPTASPGRAGAAAKPAGETTAPAASATGAGVSAASPAAGEAGQIAARTGGAGQIAAQTGEAGRTAAGQIENRHEPAAPAGGRPTSPGASSRRHVGIAVAAAAGAVLTVAVLAFVVLGRQPDGGDAVAPPAAAVSPDHDDSQFEGDITYPDGTVVPPNSSFTKIWRIRNTGTVVWANRFLGRVNEQPCQAPTVVAVPQTKPGATVDIAVTVRTPAKPGRCKIYWKMADEQGRTLFPLKRPIFLDVQVGGS